MKGRAKCRPFYFMQTQTRKSDSLLSQRRITHPEARPHMFGDQFNGSAILDRVGLRQILHGFDQQLLSIHISRIGSTFPALISQLRRDSNRKNFGHE